MRFNRRYSLTVADESRPEAMSDLRGPGYLCALSQSPMPDQITKLTANGLAMRYGRRVLFSDLSLNVGPGLPLAITGRNGSGKSTLLKILAGLLQPTKGGVSLVVDGCEIKGDVLPHSVGFVAPYVQLYAPFSARENLAFLARARRMSERNERIEEVLQRVGLAERAEDQLSTYSTGMRQRLRIAAALLHDPPLLLLDEPSATLDEPGRKLSESIIGMDDKIIVVATNDPDEAALCASQLCIVDQETG